MINPGTLLDDIVNQLRLVVALVAEMDGNAELIVPYYDSYPSSANLIKAIYDLPAPGILVVYDGTAQGGGHMQPWAHQFRLVVKLGEKDPEDTGATHYAALHLLADGIPTGSNQNLVDMEINSGCDGMIAVPRFERQSLIIDAAGNQMDYWVCRYTLTEKAA